MPELPDVVVYIESLERHIVGETLDSIRLNSPFVLRSVAVPVADTAGKQVRGLRRMGKRIVWELEDDIFIVIHLMIAGRLRWREPGAKAKGKMVLAAFDFAPGTIIFTEASTRKRASLHIVRGEEALVEFDRGGAEPLEIDIDAFRTVLTRENHTLKRALTDPRFLSGVGNAYSDEILHRAELSPFKQTSALSDDEWQRLYDATRSTLELWVDRLRAETGDGFPEKVTAFRKDMAVHGKYGEPCPVCGKAVQRIVYASNEANYCAECQTGGKLLADRALSRLLKQDWPRNLDELEQAKGRVRTPRQD